MEHKDLAVVRMSMFAIQKLETSKKFRLVRQLQMQWDLLMLTKKEENLLENAITVGQTKISFLLATGHVEQQKCLVEAFQGGGEF